MRKIFERVLIAVLVLVIVINIGGLIAKQLDYHQGTKDYAQAQEIAGAPDLSTVPAKTAFAASEEMASSELEGWPDEALTALAEMDLEALRAINADGVGWICIPGTDLS